LEEIMRRSTFIVALALLTSTLWMGPAAAQNNPTPVVVNGKTLSPDEILLIVAVTYQQPAPGRYWYDGVAGLWGLEGQGTAGAMPAGLTLGGSLQSNASRGTSGVYVNGRQLTHDEVAYLSQLGPVNAGRYWLTADGTYGVEGGFALGNLYAAAPAAGGGGAGGGGWLDRGDNTGVSGGGDSSGYYFMGDGWSVSSF